MEHTHANSTPTVSKRLSLGALGESLAKEYLESHGYRIVAQNWRYGNHGELDLVAQHEDCTIAIEVKTRSGTGYGHPLEAITARKASRLRRLLLGWVKETKPGTSHLRIDAIGVTLIAGEHPRIDHLQGI